MLYTLMWPKKRVNSFHCQFDLSINTSSTAVDVFDYTSRLIVTHEDGTPFWKGSDMVSCTPKMWFCDLAAGGRYFQIRMEQKYRRRSQIVALWARLDMYLAFKSPFSTKKAFLI